MHFSHEHLEKGTKYLLSALGDLFADVESPLNGRNKQKTAGKRAFPNALGESGGTVPGLVEDCLLWSRNGVGVSR